jgi:hypothetical protein
MIVKALQVNNKNSRETIYLQPLCAFPLLLAGWTIRHIIASEYLWFCESVDAIVQTA